MFGFVEPTFTAEERVEPYNEVRLAFLSGIGAFGAFRVLITYEGGTASEYSYSHHKQYGIKVITFCEHEILH